MSQLFISHSNEDKAIVDAMVARLRAQGHKSLFVDYDLVSGIAAGTDWEDELYRNLDACEGVIVVCSQSSMDSQWCFAEILIARRQGKDLFPIKVAPCQLHPMLLKYQVIDLTEGEEEGYVRLWRGLKSAGIDSSDGEDWTEDRNRPPYPGLASFEERDAPVFFGRKSDISRGSETLRQMRMPGGSSFLLVLGASGSGKSSLVRAGILPRLKGNDEWLAIDPLRPGFDPFGELAEVLADAFRRNNQDRSPNELRRLLLESNRLESMLSIARDLRRGSGRKDATILFTIDQFEELLDPQRRNDHAAFLSFLSAVTGSQYPVAIVIATLRSDFLASFQKHPALSELRYLMLAIRPMSRQGFRDVIEGPAKRAGVEIEEALVEQLLEDTQTPDALPLLAFVLRELWEGRGQDRKLTLAKYRAELQGLEGAIGRVAERALAAEGASEADRKRLWRAFRQLVRVDEDKQLVKQRAVWNALPQEVHPLLRRLVQARLLVSGQGSEKARDAQDDAATGVARTLEVAHEALFCAWEPLKNWLKNDEDFLLWRRRLRLAMEGWKDAGQEPESLLSGKRLDEATGWLNENAGDLQDNEREYITRSIEHDRRSMRIRLAARTATVTIISALVLGVLYIGFTKWQAERQRVAEIAENRLQRALDARDYRDNPLKAALLFLKAAEILPDEERARNARRAAGLIAGEIGLVDMLDPGSVDAVLDMHPNAHMLIVRESAGALWIWDIDSGKRIALPAHNDRAEPAGALFLQDGRVLTWDRDGAIGIIDGPAVTGAEPPRNAREIAGIDLDAEGRHAVTYGPDKVYVWALADGALVRRLQDGASGTRRADELEDKLIGAAISSDGRKVLGHWAGGDSQLWDIDSGELVETLMSGAVSFRPSFSPDGRFLLHAPRGVLQLIASETGDVLKEAAYPSDAGDLEGGFFFPDGDKFLVWTSTGLVEIWDAKTFAPIPNHSNDGNGAIYRPLIGPDGERVLIRQPQTLKLWNPGRDSVVEIRTPSDLRGAFFNDSGFLVLGWADDNQARLWDSDTGQLIGLPMLHPQVDGAGFLAGGDRVLSWGAGGTARLWSIGDSNPLAGRLLPARDVLDVGIDDSGKIAVTVETDGEVKRWDVSGRPLGRPLKLFSGDEVDKAQLSGDGSRLIGWSQETVTLWSTDTGEALGRIDLPREDDTRRLRADLSPDASRVILWGHGFPPGIWTPAANPSELLPLENPPQRLLDLPFSAQGRWIVGRDREFVLHRWDATNGSRTQPKNGIQHLHAEGVRLSENAKLLVSWDDTGELRLRDPDTGEPSGDSLGHRNPVVGAEFDPEGSRLLTWTDQGDIQIWDLDTRSRRFGAVSHRGENLRAVWDPDGRRFVTANRNSLRVWDAVTGFPLTPSLRNGSPTIPIRVGPHADVILAWDSNQVRRWDLALAADPSLSLAALEMRCGCWLTENGEVNALSTEDWKARREAVGEVTPLAGD